jgi:general secretion pathway protein H
MTARRKECGFSFTEVMIVIVIIGFLMAGVGLSVGATDRVKLRSSCWTLMAAVRYAYSRAVTQGTTTRLVLDFGEHTMHIEETKGRVVLNPEDETGEGLKRSEEDEERREASVAGEASKGDDFLDLSATPAGTVGGGMDFMSMAMGGMADGTFDLTTMMSDMTAELEEKGMGGLLGNEAGFRPPAFKPLPGKRGKQRELEGDTIFKKVFSPHEPDAREEGRAYIYFFPNGMTEHTFVQLSDGDERIYTVEIHPLTGKSIFFNEEVAPEEDLDDLQEAEE